MAADGAPARRRKAGGSAREVLANLGCGAAAGAIAKTLEAPLDRVKVVYQVDPHVAFSWSHALKRARRMVAEDGPLALFRGNTAQLARIIPNAAINFAAHDFMADHLDARAAAWPLVARHWLSGCFAGAVAVLATYPLELARVRIAVSGRSGRTGDEHGPSNLREAVREMAVHWRRGGPRGPFAGLGLTLAGMVPYSGVTWASYEWLKQSTRKLRGESPDAKIDDRAVAACGAVAGLLGQTVTYPIDTVRKRLQATRVHQSGLTGDAVYAKLPSASAVARDVVANEGLRGLFKGYTVNWVKAPIALGTSFLVYKKLQEWVKSGDLLSPAQQDDKV